MKIASTSALIRAWWGICEMLEGTAAALRVGCALETQISPPLDWLQDEAPILFVLYYKCLVSAHCLARQSP